MHNCGLWRSFGRHPFVITRAVENQIYVMSLSRAHPHFGESVAVGPVPHLASERQVLGRGPELLPLLVERPVLEAAREEYAFRVDRRSDYADLAAAAAVAPPPAP